MSRPEEALRHVSFSLSRSAHSSIVTSCLKGNNSTIGTDWILLEPPASLPTAPPLKVSFSSRPESNQDNAQKFGRKYPVLS
jgi:hypothetical protein